MSHSTFSPNLHPLLTTDYSEADLQALSAELGLPPDKLSGTDTQSKVAVLLDWATASGQLLALENHVLRRHANTLDAALTHERTLAHSRHLAQVAVGQLKLDPERAILIALEARQIAPTYDARDALQQALEASHVRLAFQKDEEAHIEHAYFASDNQRILTGGSDGWLRWWDSKTGQELSATQLCHGSITRMTLSPMRHRAWVALMNRDTDQMEHVVIDCDTGKQLAALPDDIYDATFFFSNDGRFLVSDFESDISLWDAETGACLSKSMAVGRCFGISQDATRALIYHYDGTAAVYDLRTRQIVSELDVPEDPADLHWTELNPSDCPFSPDGKRVTAGRGNRMVYVWNADDGSIIHALGERVVAHKAFASFTPSGQFIIVYQNDSIQFEVWDAVTGEWLTGLSNSSSAHASLRFLRAYTAGVEETEYAIVGLGSWSSWPYGENNILSEWDICTGHVDRCFYFSGKSTYTSGFLNDGGAWFSPERVMHYDLALDATAMLSLGQGIVRVYNRNEPVANFDDVAATKFGTRNTRNRFITYSRVGETNQYDSKLVVANTWETIASLDSDTTGLFSLDGRHLVTTAHDTPGVRVRDPQTGLLRFSLSDYSKTITALQYMPDQNSLLVGSADGTLRIWSLENGDELARVTLQGPDGPSYEAVLSPDGSTVVTVSSGLIHVWRIKDADARTIKTTLYARGLRFSRDGTWLIALDEDIAKIWDVATLQVVSEFRNHFGLVGNGDISPDNTLAATVGIDNCVRLWETHSGREIAQWRLSNTTGANNYVNALRFSEDGHHLHLNYVPTMTVQLQDLMTLARSRVTRSLSSEEQQLYLDTKLTTDSSANGVVPYPL